MPADNIRGPHKVVLGSYNSYAAAQHAVEVLAERKFPVEHLTIVGTGLRYRELVLGRWTWGRALVAGAVTGGWLGLLIGLVFLIVSPWAATSMISAIVLGIVFGVTLAAVAHATHRRSFAAVPAITADRYEVLVDAEFAEVARRVLTDALASPPGRTS
ncbi:MAG: hypothetical protein QOE54_4332 [Streptosporangiaceae bacterium]|jgi:hypothetical protein|nr:hypothetical protein [Streptosporangiaceae bacterium]